MFRISFAAMVAVGTLGAVSSGTAAYAQESTGPSDSSRYAFYRVQDIFLRLDVHTGRVSECGWDAGGWFCRVVPDERMALESEIDRLTTSNVALKKELLDHGLSLPEGIKPDPPPDKSVVGARRLPRVDIDRVTSYVGNVWRRLVGVMANLQRDMFRKG